MVVVINCELVWTYFDSSRLCIALHVHVGVLFMTGPPSCITEDDMHEMFGKQSEPHFN